jgi:Tfp pilus assembly protein PilN
LNEIDKILIQLLRPKAPALIHCLAKDPMGEKWEYEYFLMGQSGHRTWEKQPPFSFEKEHFFICISGPVILKKEGFNPFNAKFGKDLQGFSIKNKENEIHFFAKQECVQKPLEELKKIGLQIIGGFWLDPFLFSHENKADQTIDLDHWLSDHPWKNLPPGFKYLNEFEEGIFQKLEKQIIRKWIPLILLIALLSGLCEWYVDHLSLNEKTDFQRVQTRELKRQKTQDESDKQYGKLLELGFFTKSNISQILDRIASKKPPGLFWTQFNFQEDTGKGKLLTISGRAKDPNVVFGWARELKEVTWIEKAWIHGMKRNKKTQKVEFEIMIRTSGS